MSAADQWWDATRERRLLVQTCAACSHRQHHPRSVCTACGSVDLGWTEAQGTGTVYSFTVVHRSPDPTVEAPYALALVQLAEGPRLLTHLVADDLEALRCDAPVRLDWRRHPDDADPADPAGREPPRHLPVFRPE